MNYTKPTTLLIITVILIVGGLFAWKFWWTSPSVIDKWVGEFEYTESIPSGIQPMVMRYTLNISETDNELKALLSIDGYQTLHRIEGAAKLNGKKLDIFFEKFLPEHIGSNEVYQKGDMLFSLEKVSDKEYKILWTKMKSLLLDGEVQAKFTKISSSNELSDETANWQTYRNKEYGFEIKYPADVQIKSLGKNISFDFADGQRRLDIKIVIEAGSRCHTDISWAGDAPSITIDDTVFTGVASGLKDEPYDSIQYCAIHNGVVYELTMRIIYSSTLQNFVGQDQLLSQMFSTFRFTE